MKNAKKCLLIVIGTYLAVKVYNKIYDRMVNDKPFLQKLVCNRKKMMQSELNEGAITQAQSMEISGEFREAANYYIYALKNGYNFELLFSFIRDEMTKSLVLAEMNSS